MFAPPPRLLLALTLLGAAACPRPKPAPEPPAADEACAPTAAPRATPLRLLTRAEYGNTVRDLLGDLAGRQASLPQEPLVRGFDNDAAVNQVSVESLSRYLEAAEALAATALRDRRSLVIPCNTLDDACRDAFLRTLGRRAFRRPVSAEEHGALATFFDGVKATSDFDSAAEATVQVLLQSPQFLYRDETSLAQPQTGDAPLSDFQLATRLAYFAWATMPDDQLLDAAARGELRADEGLKRQAERLLDDPRALDGELRFFSLWLGLDRVLAAEKSPAEYPTYTPALPQAWRTSLELFLREVLATGGTLDGLLLTPALYANDAMNAYVGGGMTPAFARVAMPPAQRAGLLTQPGFLALLSAPDQSSPVRRGAFVFDKLLCVALPPPPSGIAISPPAPTTTATTRQRFEFHSKDPSCSGCHQVIDPVGFTFEHYDALGAWRDLEHGLPIDATGGITEVDDPGLLGTVDGAVALSKRLAASPQVRDCLAGEYLRFALGRSLTEGDACSLASVRQGFSDSGGSFRALVLSVVMSPSFRSHGAVEVQP